MGVKVPGPDPTDDLHAVNYGFLKSIVGTVQDWAKQLTDGLGSVTTAYAATKTVPGIVQLATAAQALAGTDDSAALTSLQALYRDEVRRYATVAAMNADVGNVRDGMLATLPAITTTNGKVLASTWRVTGGYWYPLVPLKCLNAATLTDLKAWPTTYTNVSFDPRFTLAQVIRDGSTAANGWDEYVWLGASSGFFLWNGYAGEVTLAGGSVSNSNGNRGVFVRGEWMDVNVLATSGSSSISQFSTVGYLPATTCVPYTPQLGHMAGGVGTWSTGWGFYCNSNDRGIRLLSSTSISANSEYGYSGVIRRAIPTS